MAKKKEKKKESISIFNFIDAITYTKQDLTKHPDFQKLYNPFMIDRWLSMNKSTLNAAFYADQILSIPKENHFKFLQNTIAEEKVWLSYEKRNREYDDLEVISNYYNVSFEEAKEILFLIDVDQLELIKNSFGGKLKK